MKKDVKNTLAVVFGAILSFMALSYACFSPSWRFSRNHRPKYAYDNCLRSGWRLHTQYSMDKLHGAD